GVAIRVELKRPATRRGELHGLYTPANGHGRDAIRLWMITAKRGQVVAYRTFLRTLLHEICHHLDYTYLHLRDSLHTQGFYQRECRPGEVLGQARHGAEPPRDGKHLAHTRGARRRGARPLRPRRRRPARDRRRGGRGRRGAAAHELPRPRPRDDPPPRGCGGRR